MLTRLRRTPAAALLLAAAIAPFADVGAFHAASAQTAPPRVAKETAAPAPLSIYNFFDPLIDIERIVAERFVAEPDLAKMRKAAINGMLESLSDPYTQYISSEEFKEFDKNIRGEYAGIGASVRQDDAGVMIVSPLEDSPALHAGLMAGDVITEIEGESVAGVPVDLAVEKLTGEPGTPVTFTVRRGEETFTKTLTREKITQRTVAGFRRSGESWDFMLDPKDRIGYIRLSQFTGATAAEVETAARSLVEAGAQGIILDVRFNPGGLLSAATQIADLFLDSGLIVTTKGRAHRDESVYAAAENTLPDVPLVVIINRESASASEVLAGALRDNGRAITLGTRSFGKGSVQSVLPLPSGAGQLKLTEQRYFGPSGKMIHRTDEATDWGVDPSEGFFVPMTDDEYREMLRIRSERSIIRRSPGVVTATSDPAQILAELKDTQLAAAVEALRTRIAAGDWKPLENGAAEESSVELEELRRAQLLRERILRELDRVEKRVAALASAVPQTDADRPRIIPESAKLQGGRLEIYDAAGELVTTLDITEEGLESWLVDAPVKAKDDSK